MTVLTNKNRDDYTGNGSVSSYPYTFKIFSDTDLEVYRIDTDGNDTLLTLNVDYTVTGAGDAAGGTVELTVVLPLNYELAIVRVLPVTQETSFRNQGPFYPARHEDAYDKLTMILQQLLEHLERTLTAPISNPDVSLELPPPEAGTVLGWNAIGDALINVASASASLQANLADASDLGHGDALLAVHQPYTGAINQTQHDFNRVYVNVMQFGATGDGVTDDADAIQTCIDSYRFLYFPPGQYRITHGLVLTYATKLLGAGEGAYSTIVRDFSGADETDGMLVLMPTSAGSDVEGLNFYTQTGQTGGSIIYGYSSSTVGNGLSAFRNCRFSTTGTDTHDYTVLIDGSAKVTGALGFRGIWFTDCSIFGARLANIEFRSVVHGSVLGGQVPAAGGTGEAVRFTGNATVLSQSILFAPGDTNCDIYFDYATYIMCKCSVMSHVYNTANTSLVTVEGHSAFAAQNNWVSSRFIPTNPTDLHVLPGGLHENVTGDGTEYPVIFNGTLYNYDSSYNYSTGVWTATQPGVHLVSISLKLSGILNTHTSGELKVYHYNSAGVLQNTHSKVFNPYNMADASGVCTIDWSSCLDVDGLDYVTFSITVTGGTLVVDILATTTRQTWFQVNRIR